MIGIAALIIMISSQYSFIGPAISNTESYIYAKQVDTTSDDSITRYVGPDAPLQFLRYRPTDLVDLNNASFAHVQGGIGQLRKEAFDQFADMAFHFYHVFRRKLEVVSSYRSYGLQNSLFAGYTSVSGPEAAYFSALPGHSEHQLGLALDLFTANTADVEGYNGYYDRLKKNAYKRGFTQSYQNGADTDGYIIEPWHWRYVGKRLATELYLRNITFSQWVHRYK